jgi:hypothetical protein
MIRRARRKLNHPWGTSRVTSWDLVSTYLEANPPPQLSNVMDLGRDQEDQGRHHEDPHHNSAVLDETPNLQSLISMLSP